MNKVLKRLRKFRELEPVRFDNYIRSAVMSIAAGLGIALKVDTAGFIVAGLLYLVWGFKSAGDTRNKVTPVVKLQGREGSSEASDDPEKGSLSQDEAVK